MLLDAIFGGQNFLNEVVWKRTGTHSSAKRWGPVHDVVLGYAKEQGEHIWNRPYTPLDEEHLKRHYRHIAESGRRYEHGELTAPGTRNGRSGLPWRAFDVTAIGRHWITTVERLDELHASGRIYLPTDGSWPRLIRYQDESKGRAIGDVWTDIPPLGLDHGVGHFRPLSITRQRHLLAYHGTARSHASLCQVFWQFLSPQPIVFPSLINAFLFQ